VLVVVLPVLVVVPQVPAVRHPVLELVAVLVAVRLLAHEAA